MSKLRIFFLSLGLFLSLILNGQYSAFDLSKYKLPDIKVSRLDFNFDFSNTTSKSSNSVTGFTSLDNKSNSRDFEGQFKLNYNRFRNSEKYQGNLNIQADFSPDLIKTEQNDLVTKDNNTNTSFLISSINRFYIKNLFFIEADANFSTINTNTLNSNSTREDMDDQSNTNLSIPLSIGYGRIEPVEDVRLAIYILEELNKVGRIKALPSDDVIIEMAKEISKIKRKRFFDTRLRKIEELRVIDSFLVANAVISTQDINYFAVLNDQWDYASGPSRESGFVVNAGIDNNLSFIKDRQETAIIVNPPVVNKYSMNIYEVGGFVSINYAKPVNLYWQTSVTMETSYNLQSINSTMNGNSLTGSDKYNIFRTYLSFQLKFLPDSRTSIGLNLSSSYQNQKGEQASINGDPVGPTDITGNSFSVYTGVEMYYYISPRMRLQLDGLISINNVNTTMNYSSMLGENTYLNKQLNQNISLSFIYSFF